ncbi:uncharacterized protein N7496_004019 [Penicillium cataractarum]|uniref:DUF6594 domain-containing protein n=1 Tax=Penicillium cataractarum TaxID=2100454 RepID=A0A9W9SNC6_9EURO|nr:uncharacterized protein N7496_004019 [Penicillium cataractarum]KAJ5381591.1 hypothetical protein N7496_004019 [Penicillium cataractarum]
MSTVQQSDSENPKQFDLYKRPWQYLGYPAFCEWSASDNDFFVLRRFKVLNNRVLLRMQDSISQLEEELAAIDAKNSRLDIPPVNNGSFRNDQVERREEILTEAQSKLKEYNAILPEESKYITSEDDLIRVVEEKKSPLLKRMERYSSVTRSIFFKKKPETDIKGYDPESMSYYDDSSMEALARSIIVILGLVMLVAPQWWLLFVQDKVYQLGIITGFIVLFLALVATLTGAKPFESLAATAAYSAVLMVFMQVGGNMAQG